LNTKKLYVWATILLVAAMVALAYGISAVRGKSPDVVEFDTIEEAQSWLEERGLEVANPTATTPNFLQETAGVTAIGCSHTTIVPDSNLAGPLGVNTQVVQINKAFCEDRTSPLFNTELLDIGSRWPGDPAKPTQLHRVWGLVAVRNSATMELVTAYAFDVTGDPSLTTAVQTQINWLGPTDGKQYRFDAEVNARALPENVGPATHFESWFVTTGMKQVFLPLIVTSDAEICPFKLHVKSSYFGDTDETYCFTPTGISHAELHFTWGEPVASWWEDTNGNKLTGFPGTDVIYRLDSPHSYRDYPETENLMIGNEWYPTGPAPWLATHHELSGQFVLGDVAYRVTVPMIWDP